MDFINIVHIIIISESELNVKGQLNGVGRAVQKDTEYGRCCLAGGQGGQGAGGAAGWVEVEEECGEDGQEN